MRVLIADDEALARTRVRRLLSAMPEVEVAGEVTDGREVLSFLAKTSVDVVLLDVQMPNLSGTEALALWPPSGPMVVFCTAHAEHAVSAFESGAVDYLLKPIDAARLQKALGRVKERAARERFSTAVRASQLERIAVTTRHGVLLLDPKSITHATLGDELVTLFTKEGQHLTDFTLQELHDRLPGFERVHRRSLLNLEAVARLEPLETGGYTARTHEGHAVEVSRQAARELRRRLGLRKPTGED